MRNKRTFEVILTITVLFLSLWLVSADSGGFELIVNGDGQSSSIPVSGENGTTHTVNVILNHTNATLGDVTVNWSGGSGFLTLPSEGNVSVGESTFNFNLTLPANAAESYRVLTATLFNISNLTEQVGEASVNIHYNSTLSTSTASSEEALCVMNGSLRISEFSVSNLGNGGDDEWGPLDEIEIEVEIENIDNSDSVSNVLVEIFIFDDDANDVTNDFDITDETIDLGRIKDDNQEMIIFEIKEIPGDINEGDYRIYIKAYSEDDEAGQCVSESNDFENNGGEDSYHGFEVLREDDPAVVVKGLWPDIFQASCGDQDVEISFSVYNIGTVKEDKVLVTLYNKLLGINELVEIDNLKEGKQKEITFLIDIPEELALEKYNLDIITYFEYDDGNELEISSYDSNSEEDLENGDFTARLEILSCSGPEPSVGADLISEAIVGKELRVSALVTNNGEENEFDFTLSGLEGWAELVSISPGSSTIGSGETIEVLISLNPLKDGAQTFKLNIISDGEISDQPISINVAEQKGFSIGNLSDTAKYLASAITALIILIFVTLIVKISRKSAKAEF